MPTCYDSASPGPPALDGSEENAARYKFGSQPKEKVTRPLDRRAASLLVRERVEKTRKAEAAKNSEGERRPEEVRVSQSPVASPKSDDDGHLTARSLTKEEKTQLINESASHPYLKRLLQGIHVLRNKETTVRPTHASQLREQQHKKQSTFATPPPALHVDQLNGVEEEPPAPRTPTSWGDAPPPWVLSKHSLLNKNKNQEAKPKKKRKSTRSPVRTPNSGRMTERKSEPSPFPHVRGKVDTCIDDAKNYPDLHELRSHTHDDKNGKADKADDEVQKLAIAKYASDTSDTDTASPARSRSSPAPVLAKQLIPKRGRKIERNTEGEQPKVAENDKESKEKPKEKSQKGNSTPRSKGRRGGSQTPEPKRETFSARPSYSPTLRKPLPSPGRPLPSPGRDGRSPRPFIGQSKPVWRS
eukprot:TRINITY_DN22378_c0_g1_i2.p1 TRINITY_DN22378_c0_g1~~TRINITY_DN22378_c0_g1_i2.p1  ORF type:complete len:414 (+),score=79.86 TRINITY_DN22378_c0_g1_i2:44-1285(+)